jgi:hypothetical protein
MVVIETVEDIQELCTTELAAAIDIIRYASGVESEPAKESSSIPGPRHPGRRQDRGRLEALSVWYENRMMAIAEYYAFDVKVTNMLPEHGAKNREVFYANTSKQNERVKVRW